MNREIKFRVWDKRDKRFLSLEEFCIHRDKPVRVVSEYFEGQGEFDEGYSVPALQSKHESVVFDKSLIAQQYTGLKDKNGKEIYEGDIVNLYTPAITHGPDREDYKNQEVLYDEEYATFLFGRDLEFAIVDGIRGLEVVGNIFENQELKSTTHE